jgi:chromosome partitioning protein
VAGPSADSRFSQTIPAGRLAKTLAPPVCSTWNIPQLVFHVKHLASLETPLLNSRCKLGDSLARVIAIANQKGGVGKTTTAVNLGASLAANESRTLVIDSDPQGNATSALGFPKDPARRTLYQTLILGEPIERVAINARVERLDLIPSDKNLVGAAVELVGMENREYRLKEAIQSIREKYDYILIDCPPSLDLLTLNALAASDSLLVPIQCEYLALEGVSELLDTLMRIRRTINPNLSIEGILLTMYDDRTTLSKQVAADLRSFFGAQVFESVIPRNVRLAEAPSHGLPVINYDIHSKGAESYIQLAKEVISNAKKRVGQGSERADTGTGTNASAASAGAGSGTNIDSSGSHSPGSE